MQDFLNYGTLLIKSLTLTSKVISSLFVTTFLTKEMIAIDICLLTSRPWPPVRVGWWLATLSQGGLRLGSAALRALRLLSLEKSSQSSRCEVFEPGGGERFTGLRCAPLFFSFRKKLAVASSARFIIFASNIRTLLQKSLTLTSKAISSLFVTTFLTKEMIAIDICLLMRVRLSLFT